MNKIMFLMMTIFAVAQAEARTPAPPEHVVYAKVTDLKLHQGFPAAKGEVTFIQKCGMFNPRVEMSEPFFSPRVGGEAIVKVRVKTDYKRVRCIVGDMPKTLEIYVKTYRHAPLKLKASNDFDSNPFEEQETATLEKVELDSRLAKIILDERLSQQLDLAKKTAEVNFNVHISGISVEKLNESKQILSIELKQTKRTGFTTGITKELGVIEVDLLMPMDAGYILQRVEFLSK